MKAFLSGVALAALVAGSPALAQETVPQPAAQEELQAAPACPEGQTCPDAAAPDATGSIPAQPADDATAQTEEQQPDATQLTAEAAPKFIQEQDDDTILASELMGQTVYDSADQSLGDINDVVWTDDGQVKGVIVGVGGFLGIGEKNVAVNYDALTVATDENGNKRLILDATSDELAAAPEFHTTAEKVAELQAQQPVDQGMGMTPLPQPEPAPAQ